MFIAVNKKKFKKNVKKRIKAVAIVCCAVLAIGVAGQQLIGKVEENAITTAADGNWGLSFQNEGQRPVANATAEFLKKYNAFYAEDTTENVLYLTFDAGYENGNTPKILEALKKHNAPACFFLVGNFIETNPELVKQMIAEGHTVGNHTMHHPDMSSMNTKETFQKELTELEDLYKTTTGAELSKFYRPPQGKYSEENLKMASEMGYTTVFWSLAYVDWYEKQQPSKHEAFDKLIPRIHPGAIVLLHSTSSTNAEILDELLTKWEEMGYSFKPLSDLTASSAKIVEEPTIAENSEPAA